MTKTICVDLDGVLAEYDGWKGIDHIGDPIPGARVFLKSLHAIPAKVRIHTTRTSGSKSDESLPIVEAWLNKHDMQYDSVSCGGGKPIAAAYVDDKAVVCKPREVGSVEAYGAALRLCIAIVRNKPLGPSGKVNEGYCSEHDKGDLNIMLSDDGDNIRIDFGTSIKWLGLDKKNAIEFANMIIKYVKSR